MLKNSFMAAMTGGKVLTIGMLTGAALMGTTALAQTGEVVTGTTTVVETPAQNTAVVPGVAAAPSSPVGAVSDPGYPLLEQLDNDQAIAQSLISQGFSDVHILREGAILTVNAQRNGQPTELVYSIANGSLVSVDGVELRDAPDQTGDGQSAAIGADSGAGDGTDDGADTGDGSDDGADAGDDGSDADGDAGGGDSDSDGGSDGSDSDGGSEGGSDGGSEGGSDGSGGGSDGGGDSNG